MAQQGQVHVIDDDAAVRNSLAVLLDAAGLSVRCYDSPVGFLEVATQLAEGVVLTDVRMPGMDGLTLQRRLADLGSRLPVIIMTGHADVPLAVDALKAGAADFLEKPFDDTHLLDTLRRALETSRRVHEQTAASAQTAARLASLTPREREVLDRLVAGQPNKTIAYDLGTSPRTVEVQRARVMEKMAARNLAELVRMVIALEAACGKAATG